MYHMWASAPGNTMRHALNSAGWDGRGESLSPTALTRRSLLFCMHACLRDQGKRGPNPLGLHKHGRADHPRLMHVLAPNSSEHEQRMEQRVTEPRLHVTVVASAPSFCWKSRTSTHLQSSRALMLLLFTPRSSPQHEICGRPSRP